eukprot:scaffold36298_cov122-Isochrysis_galbana.AAC.7
MGGCSNSLRGVSCTPVPCLEPELSHLVSRGPAVRCAKSGRAAGCRAGGILYTWVEPSSVLSTRTRLAPLSAVESTSTGSSRSWRGAIVPLHAHAELCFSARG